MKKLLVLVATLVFSLTLMSVSIFAAAPKTLGSVKGSAGSSNAGPVKDEAAGTLTVAENYNNCVWDYNFESDAIQANKVLKVGVLVTISEVLENGDEYLIMEPCFQKTGEGVFCDPAAYHSGPYAGLDIQDYVGKKVWLVCAFTVPDDNCVKVQVRFWFKGVGAVIHEVVMAENGYNFANYKDFEVVDEKTAVADTNAADNIETVEKGTATSASPATTKPTTAPTDSTGDKPETPATADPAVATYAILASGAVVTGLKLRKK